jgi:hypothetical protein
MDAILQGIQALGDRLKDQRRSVAGKADSVNFGGRQRGKNQIPRNKNQIARNKLEFGFWDLVLAKCR